MARPARRHLAGFVFTLVRLGVLAAMRRAWRGDRGAARARRGGARRRIPAARRMAMLSGIAHTLWLLALAGMVFPI